MFFTLLQFLPVCSYTSQVEDIYAKSNPSKLVSIISIDNNMVKLLVNTDGVSLFHP